MRMPGFTAESSICIESERYRYTVVAVQTDKPVRPANNRNCMKQCMSQFAPDDPFAHYDCDCICNHHPLHDCWPM